MQQYDPRMRQVAREARLLAALRALRLGPTRVSRRAKAPGQAVVEFLIVLGVFVMLVFGLVCVGQILLANYTVNQAARAAAHQAALEGGEPEVAYSAAESAINAGVGTDYANATVSVVCSNPANTAQRADPCRRYYPITVNIRYTGAFWAPLPPLFTDFTVASTATRAAERDQQ